MIGTDNWDVILSKMASIVTAPALATKAGDVMADSTDGQKIPYLT